MDFLGVGPLELVFIFIIVLIIFGPNDIVRAGRSLGSFLRKVVTSDAWRAFQQASKGMRDLPTTLMREAGLEEQDLRELTGMKDFEDATKDLSNQISPWTTPPNKRPEFSQNPVGGLLPEEPIQPDADSASGQEQPKTQSEPPPGSPFSQNIDENN